MRVRRHPRNLYVLVAGPDGSGKSAITQRVIAALRERDIPVEHLHFIPRQGTDGGDAVTAPHALAPRSLAPAVLAVLHRFARYVHATTVGALSRGFGGLQIQERGWLDQVADPLRYRLPRKTRRLVVPLARVLRRPDLLVLCDGDPLTMATRKPELSVDEVAAQLSFWRGNPPSSQQAVHVDTTAQSVDESVTGAMAAIQRSRTRQLSGALRRVDLVPSRMEMRASAGARPAVQALYRPGRSRGLVARELGAALLPRPRPRPRPCSTLPVPFDLCELLDGTGVAFDDVALIRSSGRERWVVGLVRDSRLVAVVKVGHGHDHGLLAEAAWLEEMRGASSAFSVPTLIGVAKIDAWHVLAMAALPVPRLPTRPDLDLALDICVGLARARDGVGVTHGDLAPWNILNNSPPWLVDWEHAREYEPGVDIAHYIASRSSLAGFIKSDHARALLAPGSPLLRRLAQSTGHTTDTIYKGVDRYLHGVHNSVRGRGSDGHSDVQQRTFDGHNRSPARRKVTRRAR